MSGFKTGPMTGFHYEYFHEEQTSSIGNWPERVEKCLKLCTDATPGFGNGPANGPLPEGKQCNFIKFFGTTCQLFHNEGDNGFSLDWSDEYQGDYFDPTYFAAFYPEQWKDHSDFHSNFWVFRRDYALDLGDRFCIIKNLNSKKYNSKRVRCRRMPLFK